MGIGSSHRSERDASLANISYSSSSLTMIQTKRQQSSSFSSSSQSSLFSNHRSKSPMTTTMTNQQHVMPSTRESDTCQQQHLSPNLENLENSLSPLSLASHDAINNTIDNNTINNNNSNNNNTNTAKLQHVEIPNRETLQHFTDYYYSMCVPNDWRVEVYGGRGGGIVIRGGQPTANHSTTNTNKNSINNSNNNNSIHTNNNNTTPTSVNQTAEVHPYSTTNNSNHSSQAVTGNSTSCQMFHGQKIYFSSYDKNVEKDFIEIYVTFSPNDIEKEAKLAIDDINQMGKQESDDYFGSLKDQTTNSLKRLPSSPTIRQGMSQMSQQAGFSRVIEPKIVKGITHVIGKKIQPEKKALYFVMQFRHELLPQKLLYKKIYFIQEGNGIIYCLTLTTTRREPEDVIGYTSTHITDVTTNSPLLTSRENQSARSARSSSIPAIYIESHACHTSQDSPTSVTSHSNRHSKNLSLLATLSTSGGGFDSSNSVQSSPSMNGDHNSNTLSTNSQPNSARKRNSSSGSATTSKKTFMKMVTSALSTSAIESDNGDEMSILTGLIPSLYPSMSQQQQQSTSQPQLIDGGVWSDILVRELFVGKSLNELKRKTSNMDGEGVIIHVPICFIPSLKLETDGEQEIIKHYGISDFGKRKQDYKLILYHPIQYLTREQYLKSTKEEMVENIFVTYVDFVKKKSEKNLIEFYLTGDACGNCAQLEKEIASLTRNEFEKNSGKLLNYFYDNIFKEKVKKSCSILKEKDMEFYSSSESNQEGNNSIFTKPIVLKAKYLELDGNTYFGNTLKKQCCLVERNFKIWIFTYSSTSNLIASEAFHAILSEIKYS
nr:unnamed protein product [Naegleria fowleri]